MSEQSHEVPIGKRSDEYRLLERIPTLLFVTFFATLAVFVFIAPELSALLLSIVILYLGVKIVRATIDMIRGYRRMVRARNTDWPARLREVEEILSDQKSLQNESLKHPVQELARNYPELVMRPSELIHAVIIAAYDESYEVLQPTVQNLAENSTENSSMIVVLAYEERGGEEMARTAARLQQEFSETFLSFRTFKHPANLPGEIQGKGANISHAAEQLQQLLDAHNIAHERVIVTSLDADNRPHPQYFDSVSYEYVIAPNRKNLAFQPISLFDNNVWDTYAPMRLIAVSNTLWNLIASVRTFALRNFASHSQPLSALAEMGYWSKRTVVEDGHQYWRSYFHFKGNYRVVPIYLTISQDAIIDGDLASAAGAQFKQLSRWYYGASDIAYVADGIFVRKTRVPFGDALTRFLVLLESHFSLAILAIMMNLIALVPLTTALADIPLDDSSPMLHLIIVSFNQIAVLGLMASIIVSLLTLPKRPERYGFWRSAQMLLHWLLLPITVLFFTTGTAINSQWKLFLGKYPEKFAVTKKMTHAELNFGNAGRKALGLNFNQRK